MAALESRESEWETEKAELEEAIRALERRLEGDVAVALSPRENPRHRRQSVQEERTGHRLGVREPLTCSPGTCPRQDHSTRSRVDADETPLLVRFFHFSHHRGTTTQRRTKSSLNAGIALCLSAHR